MKKLLSVEDRHNPVEIVVHVNMLKEGWDVTNLYTIVPLRTANSKTLVEQSDWLAPAPMANGPVVPRSTA
ncbi:MAG: hypothetical protein R2867_07680 [Caldilineaceae bacterium]